MEIAALFDGSVEAVVSSPESRPAERNDLKTPDFKPDFDRTVLVGLLAAIIAVRLTSVVLWREKLRVIEPSTLTLTGAVPCLALAASCRLNHRTIE